MGNKGAFIVLNGKDMKPNFTTYEAVVSNSDFNIIILIFVKLACDSVNDFFKAASSIELLII
jgi:hypothetical protein